MITARGQGSTGYIPVRALFEKLPGVLFTILFTIITIKTKPIGLKLNNKQAAKTLTCNVTLAHITLNYNLITTLQDLHSKLQGIIQIQLRYITKIIPITKSLRYARIRILFDKIVSGGETKQQITGTEVEQQTAIKIRV